MNRAIINIDLDNVVYDFAGAFHDYAEERLQRELPVTQTWDFWDEWGITKGAWNFLFRQGVEEGAIWRSGRVIPGAIEALWQLSDDEKHIRLVTNRLAHSFGHDLAVEHTVRWLRDNAIPYRSLAVIGYGEQKSNYQALTLVDDSIENVNDWEMNMPGRAVLFDQPWNHSSEIGLRAYNWADVVKFVREM